jgi:hypothetical protein
MTPSLFRFLVFGIGVLAAVAPSPAQACRCVEPPSTSAAYRTATLIVEGTVLEVTPRSEIEGFTIRLKVANAWKLDVPEELAVATGSNCRYEVEPDKKYLLFLVETQKGQFTTGRCMGNGLAVTKARSLTWLKKQGRPAKVLPKS